MISLTPGTQVLEFEQILKKFDGPRGAEVVAVRDLDLVVRAGETHCLIGTSGCGKTTTMRLVNRLEDPTRGRVLLGGEDVAGMDVIRLRRRIGYVIQSGGLFPHMTVAKNIGVMCELEGWESARVEGRVSELLRLVNLPQEFAQATVRGLSKYCGATAQHPQESTDGQQFAAHAE